MVVQFMFVPHYPIWSFLVIALDVVVIYALAVYPATPTRPHHLVARRRASTPTTAMSSPGTPC